MPAKSEEPEPVRWRTQPCDRCRAGASFLDFVVSRHRASGEVSRGAEDEVIERITAQERAWLVDWVEACPHTTEQEMELVKLDEGSEHIVYLAPGGREVIKLTRPGIYGDTYHLVDGRVHQRNCTPGDYLIRLALLEFHFGFSHTPVGITHSGQIVSVQRFVEGEPPSQEEVDDFLIASGMEPVKRNCWLWKKNDPAENVEYWTGDARADNFVKTPHGIVPIDLRMWAVRP
jgi:hypothetical protein